MNQITIEYSVYQIFRITFGEKFAANSESLLSETDVGSFYQFPLIIYGL